MACAIFLALVLPGQAGYAAPGDIQFQREGVEAGAEGFPAAIFPHWVHRIRYRCDACHAETFKMERGSSEVSMEIIGRGESCGQCHNGTEAFDVDFQNCVRCHKPPAE